MRQLVQEAANSEEDAHPPIAKWLRSIGRVLMRSLRISSAGANPAPERLNSKPRLHLTLEHSAGALNLAIANRSRVEIWAEEATVDLIDVETNGEVYSPAQSVLKIREPIAPSEIFRISLVDTVYNTAGRPQAMYSCTIATVLRFRTDGIVENLEQPFPLYRAKMVTLIPTSLRRMVRFDRSSGSSELQDLSAVRRREQSKRVRRSKRTMAQSAVVVEGRFSDGTPFVTATHALVLSAHGCLVALPKPVDIGVTVTLRSPGTLREQHCQVVYVGKSQSGEIQVGLGFEMESPEFWGTHCLPSLVT